ncbi:Nocturnin [Durusdinium trenchii]|uniref:Nocturnin n=1 Tax=Durusdinium trenchii TaxID=1381693 RepID=A0ABP0PZ48_9DINO
MFSCCCLDRTTVGDAVIQVGEDERGEQQIPFFEFLVKVSKENGKDLGCILESSLPDFCILREVKPKGPRCPLKDVQVFDRIMKVNGSGGSSRKLLQLLESEVSAPVALLLQRPKRMEVTLQLEEEAGLVFHESLDTCGLVIKHVAGPLAGSLKRMDRVIAIDGREGTASELLQLIRSQTEPLLLTICSYSTA